MSKGFRYKGRFARSALTLCVVGALGVTSLAATRFAVDLQYGEWNGLSPLEIVESFMPEQQEVTVGWRPSHSNEAMEQVIETTRNAPISGTALVPGANFIGADESEEEQGDRTFLVVKPILQNPELPTGCESVALTEALAYWGFDIPKTLIADEYMPKSSNDFVRSFIGNPHNNSGLGILAPGLTDIANSFLEDNESPLRATDITGCEFADLYGYLDEGKPVIVWTTIGLYSADAPMIVDGEYELVPNTHTVVLAGYDRTADTVTVADPLVGLAVRERPWFEEVYNDMGKQAVVIG